MLICLQASCTQAYTCSTGVCDSVILQCVRVRLCVKLRTKQVSTVSCIQNIARFSNRHKRPCREPSLPPIRSFTNYSDSVLLFLGSSSVFQAARHHSTRITAAHLLTFIRQGAAASDVLRVSNGVECAPLKYVQLLASWWARKQAVQGWKRAPDTVRCWVVAWTQVPIQIHHYWRHRWAKQDADCS